MLGCGRASSRARAGPRGFSPSPPAAFCNSQKLERLEFSHSLGRFAACRLSTQSGHRRIFTCGPFLRLVASERAPSHLRSSELGGSIACLLWCANVTRFPRCTTHALVRGLAAGLTYLSLDADSCTHLR